MDVIQKMDIESYNFDTEIDTSVLTTSSGYDESMDQCFDKSREEIRCSSPDPKFINTSNSDASSPEHHSISPPYKRVRALRLCDFPITPKTLFEKCAGHTPAIPAPRSRLFSRIEKPRGLACAQPKFDKPSANVNPFTPNGMLIMSKKRTRSKRSLVG
jgi:hypothetical protein